MTSIHEFHESFIIISYHVTVIIQLRERQKDAGVHMRKKAKKNTISDPPSHPPDIRALLPFRRAVVEELGLELGLPSLPFTVSLPFKEFSPLVVEGDVGSGSELVDAGLVGVVVEGLTRVVLDVVALVVVGLVVEGLMGAVLEVAALVVGIVVVEELTRVVLEVAVLEIVGIVMIGLKLVSRVGNLKVDVVIDKDKVMVPVTLHSKAFSSQTVPVSQHPSGPHRDPPGLHNSEQKWLGKHSYPFLQQYSIFAHKKKPSSHRGGAWHPGFPVSPTQVCPGGQHHPAFGQWDWPAGQSVCRFPSQDALVAGIIPP